VKSIVFGCGFPVKRFTFKPAFTLTQMEALGAAGTPVAPTAVVAVRTSQPIFEPITWRFLGVTSKFLKLGRGKDIIMRILA